MTTTEAEAERIDYPPTSWLRDVTFPDPTYREGSGEPMAEDDGPPVHVTTRPVRFNGVRTEAKIMRAPITVTAGYSDTRVTESGHPEPEATVLSFVVAEDDIDWGDGDAEKGEPGRGAKIGGLLVLSPAGLTWDVVDRPITHGLHSHYPLDPPVPGTRRVHVFARTIRFTAS